MEMKANRPEFNTEELDLIDDALWLIQETIHDLEKIREGKAFPEQIKTLIDLGKSLNIVYLRYWSGE